MHGGDKGALTPPLPGEAQLFAIAALSFAPDFQRREIIMKGRSSIDGAVENKRSLGTALRAKGALETARRIRQRRTMRPGRSRRRASRATRDR